MVVLMSLDCGRSKALTLAEVDRSLRFRDKAVKLYQTSIHMSEPGQQDIK